MPRPKKIVQESVVEETTSISSYVEPESIIEAKMQVIENFTDNSLIEEPIIETKSKKK